MENIYGGTLKELTPSILNVDNILGLLGEIKKLNQEMISNVKKIHIDIMDGQFVRNTNKDMTIISTVQNLGFGADVHLMVVDPKRYILDAISKGVKSITIHYEIPNFKEVFAYMVEQCKRRGIKVGIAIKPMTSIKNAEYELRGADIIHIMSVEPGLGGQKFMMTAYDKIAETRKLFPKALITVDGGIDNLNINKVLEKGANTIVVGNYIARNQDKLRDTMLQLKIR